MTAVSSAVSTTSVPRTTPRDVCLCPIARRDGVGVPPAEAESADSGAVAVGTVRGGSGWIGTTTTTTGTITLVVVLTNVKESSMVPFWYHTVPYYPGMVPIGTGWYRGEA